MKSWLLFSKPFSFNYLIIAPSSNDVGELLTASLNKLGVCKNYEHTDSGHLRCNFVSLSEWLSSLLFRVRRSQKNHNWLLMFCGHIEASTAANIHIPPLTDSLCACWTVTSSGPTFDSMLYVQIFKTQVSHVTIMGSWITHLLTCWLCLIDYCYNRSFAICLYQVSKSTCQLAPHLWSVGPWNLDTHLFTEVRYHW